MVVRVNPTTLEGYRSGVFGRNLPNDDSSRIVGNAAEGIPVDPLAAIETSSKTIPSYNNSSTALDISTPPPSYTASSIAIAETAAETANALGGQTENRTPSMVALAPIQEFHPSKKQISNFPDFSNILNQTADFDTASTMDETMSVTTTTSDYDRQYLLVDGVAGEDDIFTNSEIVVAEEASLVDEQDNLRKQKEKFLNKEVNIFEVVLDSTNVFLASNHEAHSSKRGDPNTIVVGFADSLTIDESLKQLCRDVYGDSGKITPNNSNGLKKTNTAKQPSPQLRFEIHSKTFETSINVNINGTDICLSDEVVSKLAPFVQNDTEEEKPPSLEIALENCKIEIKDPKKKFPLRIRLGDLKVNDGPESTL
ncbi:hypothetical protein DdX_02450 [Ditylenchus destructor]|uniref:Uncharacterized protein n=1 Tax=Ditylenchus destructor TaxID=166010 RepID=A0AAD4NEA4_9BILA|nr:hypothetical protein DdX_02450 [Ditylenchus destructor]